MPVERVLRALGAAHGFDQVAIAPDGRRVAWSEGGALYVTDPTRRRPRRLAAVDGTFAWSPDGTKIAVLTADRRQQDQLAVVDLVRGGSRMLTRGVRGPLADPKWSPDGRRISFLYTKDAPKTPGPLNPAARESGVVGSRFYEQRIAIASLDGAPLRVVSPADLYVYEYDWSPDGSTFAATAAHGSGDDNWWIAELYTVAARDGTTKKIHHPALQIASPRWSGDGKRIAYIGGIMSDQSVTGGDAYVVAAAGGDAVDVTPGLKASVTTLAWNGSRDTLTLTELAGGRMAIATVDADTKAHTRLWSGEELIFASSLGGFIPGDTGISVARDGRTSALVRQSITKAPEVYAGPIGEWRAITARNAAAPRVVQRAQSINWKSDDFTVQGWLLYPAGYDPRRRYPMVVVVHGGPAFAKYPQFPSGPHAYNGVLAGRGYVVFEPNPRGSYGGGEAFARANVKDFGGGDLRDILAGIDAAERVASIDDGRVGIFGWSYGGYMTMWALTQTARFRAAVAGAGLSDWLSYYGTNGIDTWMIPYFGKPVYDDPDVYAKSSPINFIKNVRTPTLMVAGDRDAEVPITQSYEYWHALKTRGVPTQLVVYPDEGHLFHQPANQADVARRIVGWFDRYLR